MITVAFRNSDVVFKPSGLGLIKVVQCAERSITCRNTVNDDTKTVNIHNFGEMQFFF